MTSQDTPISSATGEAPRGINIPPEVEQFLGRFGINEETLKNLKTMLQDVDVEEQLNTAREFLRENSEKAKTYTRENPAKVAAGVAVLAIGAGLLISALHKNK
jgi:hypothetical protein